MQGKRLFWVPAFVFFGFFVSTAYSKTLSPEKLNELLSPLVQNGSILVANDEKTLYQFPMKSERKYVPASVFKYATALLALHHLGEDFRFRTDFYLDPNQTLGIRASGDPFLISEEWKLIAENLAQQKNLPNRFPSLFWDTSLFSNQITIPGIERSINPYDAKSGALVINFNTLYVKVDRDGRVESAEKQTPLTQTAIQLSQKLKAGKHRINVPKRLSAKHMSELIKYFLEKEGFQFGSLKHVSRAVNSKDRLIYQHYNSRKLTEIVAGMMRYSNNFTANQLLLRVGMEKYGAPADLEKGVAVMNHFLSETLKIPEQDFDVKEGSGISRGNQMTPSGILTMLKAFKPYQSLLMTKNGARFKTGTLRGISTMAGYFSDNNSKQLLYFVILLNQKQNHRHRILKYLLQSNFSSGE